MMTNSERDVFMDVAKAVRGPEPGVGVCIVDPEKKAVVSSGANGFLTGGNSSVAIHAAANAIIKRSSGTSLKNCVLYTTKFPCNECAKLIIQSKISKVFSLKAMDEDIKYNAGKKLLDAAEIYCYVYPSS